MAKDLLLVFVLALLSVVDGSGNSCQDIDRDACVAMANQNAALCSDPTLSSSVCPSFCNNCPVTCYACNVSTSDTSSCNTVTCKNSMICMTKEVHSLRTGQHMYHLGCATQANCDGERRRSVQSRDVNIHCCSDDLCNIPALPTTILLSTPRPTPQTKPLATSTSTVATMRSSTPKQSICTKDIIFVVDQSEMFVAKEYSALRTALADLVSRINVGVGADDANVAIYTLDATLNRKLTLDSGCTKELAIFAMRSLYPVPTVYGFSNMTSWYAAAYLFVGSSSSQLLTGDRRSVQDVFVFITGKDTSGRSSGEIQYISNRLHAKFRNVIAVGIGSHVQTSLRYLATDNLHYFNFDDATGLFSERIKQKLLELICS